MILFKFLNNIPLTTHLLTSEKCPSYMEVTVKLLLLGTAV